MRRKSPIIIISLTFLLLPSVSARSSELSPVLSISPMPANVSALTGESCEVSTIDSTRVRARRLRHRKVRRAVRSISVPTVRSVNDSTLYSKDVLIIFFDSSVGSKPLKKAIAKYHAKIIYEYKNFNGLSLVIPKGKTLDESITYFNKVKGVLSVEKDRICHLDSNNRLDN
jgi:hypothetical protein